MPIMRIIKFEAQGKEIEFYCESRWTRNGFAHDARLFIDCTYWGCASAYYLNRTWEHWEYQTVCMNICSNAIESREQELKDAYKEEHGLTRLSGKAHKEALQIIIDSDEDIKLLREIKQILRDRCF